MALNKQSVEVNFAQGLDTKSDPKQIPVGKFARLVNTIFTKLGLLKKRNGYRQLTSLPEDANLATTFNGNLTAVGESIQAYSDGSNQWVNKGTLQPCSLETLPLIRTNLNQSQADSAISPNNLVCTVYTDNVPSGGSTVAYYKYVVADATTGQNIIAPTVITAPTGTITGSPRVFVLGNYFIVAFSNNVAGVYHLQYIAINYYDVSIITTAADITATYTPATTVAWDGVVVNNNLYLAWNRNGAAAIQVNYLDSTLTMHSVVTVAGDPATHVSLCADTTGSTPVIWVSWYNYAGGAGFVMAFSQILTTILGKTSTLAGAIANLTSTAQDGICNQIFEVESVLSYDATKSSNYIQYQTITQAGVVSSVIDVNFGIGLASKAIAYNGTTYFLTIYGAPPSASYAVNQPTYFLMNLDGEVIAKLAYSNGGSYYTVGLPQIHLSGSVISFAYFFKDLIVPVNKTTGVTVKNATYTQLGINLAQIDFAGEPAKTAEIGSDLHLTGGFLWMYDGFQPVEHGFFLYPDYVKVTTSGAGGLITAQTYNYVVLYEWADNQGNIHRSAPSIPVSITTVGATSSNTIEFPNLFLTYKTANPVKAVIYRWSTAQQTYYQVTSVSVPTYASSQTFTDTKADSAIVGNSILYTTGGVVENIAAPSFNDIALYKSRLFGIDAENPNLLWYSKQVVQGVPVEMSDLFTSYIGSTSGSQGSTGVMKCISTMDDKFIIFKDNAIYYMTGNGPDNTGANNDLSEPVFVTSTVGCNNKRSIAMIPNGLVFQSNKGIWLLGRDLSTRYIGAPVEDFNSYQVQSAVAVPGTNQVRFSLSNGATLMYDYFFDQWGSFDVSAVSSTIFEDLHTFINSRGEVYQENPGSYVDGTSPVLMGLKTGPINLGGVQGFQRAYGFFLVGEYKSPHKLSIGISYDYAQGPEQVSIIQPIENYNYTYGGPDGANYYGSGNYGGNLSLEQWQVFFQRQKCQAFQIDIQESYDSTWGQAAGEGLSLSGLDIVVGVKGSSPKLKQTVSVG